MSVAYDLAVLWRVPQCVNVMLQYNVRIVSLRTWSFTGIHHHSPTSILATRQPVIVTGWRKLWRANNSEKKKFFFIGFHGFRLSRQFRDFSTTVYCNKRLVLYKQVTILCFLYSCSQYPHVVGWYDDRRVVLPIKYAVCRTASAARCRPGRCCAPYMGSGRKKWLAVFKS